MSARVWCCLSTIDALVRMLFGIPVNVAGCLVQMLFGMSGNVGKCRGTRWLLGPGSDCNKVYAAAPGFTLRISPPFVTRKNRAC